jgi:peptidoglycan/LPS O-acetylase OafA/YrhL
MEPEVRKAPVRFYEIDLLRFLAALSVVLFHYTYFSYIASGYSPIPYLELGRFTRYGYLGVELFFLISGYVVLMSAQGKTVRQFFLSRVTRLYPAFWAACTLTFLVEAVWGKGPGDVHMADNLRSSVLQYAYNMTMFYDMIGVYPIDAAYWSLTVEIIFYFLIAVLIGFKLMPHLDLFIALWLGYAGIPGLSHHDTPFATLLFPNFAPYFSAGMLFFLMQQPEGRTWKRWGLLAVAFVLALHSASNQAREASVLLQGDTSWKVAMASVAVFFLIFLLITFRKFDLSRFTWIAKLGALTYPLYLLHSDIAFIAFHRIGHLVNKYVLLAGALVVMLLLAYLVNVLVEKRLAKSLGAQVNRLLNVLEQHK